MNQGVSTVTRGVRLYCSSYPNYTNKPTKHGGCDLKVEEFTQPIRLTWMTSIEYWLTGDEQDHILGNGEIRTTTKGLQLHGRMRRIRLVQ